MEIIDDFKNDNGFGTDDMSDSKTRQGWGQDHKNFGNKAITGIVFVIAGLLLVLKNMDIMPYYFENLIFSWPMLLIAIGLVLALGAKEKTSGWIVMGVGAFFLLPYLFNESFHIYKLFWPAVFIVIGVVLLTTRNSKRHREFSKDLSGEDYLEVSNVFSGTEKKIISQNFKGGSVSTVFGGSELDLTKAQLAPGRNELELVCFCGGVTIIVPDNWYVIIDVNPVMGGFTDSRKKTSMVSHDTGSQLVIKGTLVFGGGEVK